MLHFQHTESGPYSSALELATAGESGGHRPNPSLVRLVSTKIHQSVAKMPITRNNIPTKVGLVLSRHAAFRSVFKICEISNEHVERSPEVRSSYQPHLEVGKHILKLICRCTKFGSDQLIGLLQRKFACTCMHVSLQAFEKEGKKQASLRLSF